jgi:carboxypeptidase T
VQNGDGTYGVDLNRNYGYKWGTGGSSSNTGSETFKGPAPFSEPETRSVRDYVTAHSNISTLLSFHTYSQLILYPWGHSYASIGNARDKEVHEKMANQMAKWNGYTPQQSSELYIASGDTTDWSYGELKIISFTFELDPSRWGGGGFYPGAGHIEPTVAKNTEPVLYLLEYADNPYRAIEAAQVP